MSGDVDTAPMLPPVSTAAAAEVLGLEPQTVCWMCRTGRLAGAKVSGVWLVPPEVLECELSRRQQLAQLGGRA